MIFSWNSKTFSLFIKYIYQCYYRGDRSCTALYDLLCALIWIVSGVCAPGPCWLGSGHGCFQRVDERRRLLCEWEECSYHSAPAYSPQRRAGLCDFVSGQQGFLRERQLSIIWFSVSWLKMKATANQETFLLILLRVLMYDVTSYGAWGLLFLSFSPPSVSGLQTHPFKKEKTLHLSSLWRQEEGKEGVRNICFNPTGGYTFAISRGSVGIDSCLCVQAKAWTTGGRARRRLDQRHGGPYPCP